LNGNSPEHYYDAFQQLKTFIDQSLDMNKEELMSVLFPIFLHLFLSMIKSNFLKEAQLFLQREREPFEAFQKEHLKMLEQVDSI
jgi:transcription initiation factor TFIID subunit 5